MKGRPVRLWKKAACYPANTAVAAVSPTCFLARRRQKLNLFFFFMHTDNDDGGCLFVFMCLLDQEEEKKQHPPLYILTVGSFSVCI